MFRITKLKTGILALAMLLGMGLLCGCGKNAKSEQTEAGMEQVRQMDYSGALTTFDSALAAGEDARLVYRGKGLAYMGMTQYEQAVEQFTECLHLSDGRVQDIDFDVNYYLAVAYFRNGQTEQARDRYTAILSLRPEETDAHYLRGVAELAIGVYEDAQKDFDSVLKLTSWDCDRLLSIYQSLTEYGYKEIGQQYLEAALQEKGDKLKNYDKGRIYYYLEDYGQACSLLEQSKDTVGAEACLYLGRAYEATGDYNYATSVYNSFLAKDASNAEVYNQLGLCRMKQGEYEQALEAFQTAMKLEPEELMQTLQFNEIVAYEYLGEYQKATVLMDHYVATYPDDENAAREYEFLKTR